MKCLPSVPSIPAGNLESRMPDINRVLGPPRLVQFCIDGTVFMLAINGEKECTSFLTDYNDWGIWTMMFYLWIPFGYYIFMGRWTYNTKTYQEYISLKYTEKNNAYVLVHVIQVYMNRCIKTGFISKYS